MPLPVVVTSEPTAVAFEPNGASGSLPSPARSAFFGRQVRRRGGEPGRDRRRRQPGVGRRRRRRVRDLRHEDAGGGEQVRGVDRRPDVVGGDVGPDVAAAAARRVGDVARAADRAEVPVDAGGVAPHQRAGLLARSGLRVGQQPVDDPAVGDVGEEGVGLQVGGVEGDPVVVPLGGAEPARPLAAGRHHGVGQVADAGLRGRVALAVPQRGVVLGHDVRDVVRRPGDRGARHAVGRPQQRGRRRRRDRRARGGRRQGPDRHESRDQGQRGDHGDERARAAHGDLFERERAVSQ